MSMLTETCIAVEVLVMHISFSYGIRRYYYSEASVYNEMKDEQRGIHRMHSSMYGSGDKKYSTSCYKDGYPVTWFGVPNIHQGKRVNEDIDY